MQSWVVWLVLAAALGVAELLTLTLAVGLLAVAAIAAGLGGALGLPLALQVVVFAVTAGAGLAGVRPLALRPLPQPPARTGGAAPVGRGAGTLPQGTRHRG